MTADAPVRDLLEAEAAGRLFHYLRSAGPLTAEQEVMVRHAWMTAWRSGGRYALATSGRLADPLYVAAMQIVAAFLEPEPVDVA